MAMQGMNKQRGITLLGFIMILAVVGFFVFLGMRLVPVYAEYYSVVTDLKAACREPDAKTASLDEMRKKLERRFYISYVDSVDIKKHVKLVKDGDAKQINIAYEVRKPLIYNLDFVAKFDVTESVTGAASAE